jgi:hypothetical protein
MADDASPAGRPMVGAIKSEQDHADLLTYHITVITKAQAAVEAAKGPVDEAKAELGDKNEALTKAFNAAKADLGRHYTRKYLDGLILDGRARSTVLVEQEKIRARDKAILNQPVFGVQAELFPGEETPLEARDEMSWRHEGFLRGMRGDLEEIQSGDPPRFHQAIMLGFEEGQELAGARYLRAQQLKQRAESPDAGAAPMNLNEPEPGTPEAEEAEEASVDRARVSLEAMGQGGAEEPAGEGADGFEAPEAELEAQKPRAAVKDRKAGATSGAKPAAVH